MAPYVLNLHRCNVDADQIVAPELRHEYDNAIPSLTWQQDRAPIQFVLNRIRRARRGPMRF